MKHFIKGQWWTDLGVLIAQNDALNKLKNAINEYCDHMKMKPTPEYQGVPLKFNTTPTMRRKLRKLHDQQPKIVIRYKHYGVKEAAALIHKHFGKPSGLYRQPKKVRDMAAKYLGPAARAQARRDAKTSPKLFTARKRIQHRTSTRAAQEHQYRARVKVWIKEFAFCQFPGCVKEPEECHHSHGKRGRLLNHEPFWIPLCQKHHQWVTNHTTEAREMGLVCPEGKWNDQRLVPR